MSLDGHIGGCIRCSHDKLSFIPFLYLGPSPYFLSGFCYLDNSVWELSLEGRKGEEQKGL